MVRLLVTLFMFFIAYPVMALDLIASSPATAFTSAQTTGKLTAKTVDSTNGAKEAQVKFPEKPTQANPDYSQNLKSDVFGAHLFTGAFANQGPIQFNNDYVITNGDQLQVRFWGGFDFDAQLTVDPKGNIFLPHVGPVKVMGVRNQDLQRTVEMAVRKVFRANVYCYASLAAAQPVRVFVGGFVNRPGLFGGTSMDSLFHYLDQAGGIDPERGSFLNVQIKRGDVIRAEINLYDFLLHGRMPMVQFTDGDVIFVTPRKHVVKVAGQVANAKRFEFAESRQSVADLAGMAKPLAHATHVRIMRNTGPVRNAEYYPLQDASRIMLQNGDELEFTADKKPGTITVRVEGEHLSAQEYVLPYGAKLGDLMGQVKFTERSDADSIQLYRLSVKDRQKSLLNASLKSLETAALTARSGTSDEARLRKEEAELLLQWVERAKNVEPSGQVQIAQSKTRGQLPLENGDVLKIPAKDGLVLVSGEVLFPNAIAFDSTLNAEDYIQRAGGYTQNADASRIVVAHRDGSFDEARPDSGFLGIGGKSAGMRPGDEILVLPRIDVKSRQIAKDLSQILYYIAISAKVALGL